MDIQVKTGEIQKEKSELIAINLFEGVTELDGAAAALNETLDGQLQRIISDGDFKGKRQETMLLYTHGMIPAKRVLVVGLGKKEKFDLEATRIACATAARKVRDLRIKSYSTGVPGDEQGGISLTDAIQAAVEGIELALYEYSELKTEPEDNPKEVKHVTFVVPEEGKRPEVEAAVEVGRNIVAGVNMVRNLVNRPSNHATPMVLARHAQEIADEFGIVCQVLEEDEMAELGMGSLLAVAQGSDEPAKFIILEYNAGRDDLDTIVLVGKGITFDSGGISLKKAEGMKISKGDMAGAAAVLGAMRVAAALKLPLHIVGLMPTTENMPSGKAYKPGDVVRAMNGKTIEVISTDAEGRMILADALAYAVRYQPKAIIDLATLTGSIMVALGHQAIGLFSNNDDLSARLTAAGQTTFERVWPMPMFEEYARRLKSDVADMKHTGGREGGAITAAVFLKEFVDDLPWVHLDIAGKAFAWTDEDKPYTPYMPSWATGIGVRLLTQFLRDWVDSPPAN